MRTFLVILLFLQASPILADGFRCSKDGVSFEIKNQQVTFFYAQSSISHPDLANSYALTCVHHIGKFLQSKNRNEHILAFSESNDQYGESEDCKVHIKETGSKYHIYTTNCSSECMKFTYQMEKTGSNCHSLLGKN